MKLAIALAATVAVSAYASPVFACSCTYFEHHEVISGDEVPANAGVGVWFEPGGAGCAAPNEGECYGFAESTALELFDANDQPVDFEVFRLVGHERQSAFRGNRSFAVVADWQTGAPYTLRSKSVFGDRPDEIVHTFTATAPLPTDLTSTLVVEQDVGTVSYPGSADCSTDALAAYADIEVVLPDELKPHEDELLVHFEVDGEVLYPLNASICEYPQPGQSSLGPLKTRVFHLCEESDGGVSAGEKTVIAHVALPGAEFEWFSEPASIDLECPPDIGADAGSSGAGSDVGADAEMGGSGDQPRGCSVSGAGASGSLVVLFVVVMVGLRGRGRLPGW